MKATARDKRYMNKVAALGCLVCGAKPELHHIRFGQGMGQRAGNMLIIPLCAEHHRGSYSIHGSPRQFTLIQGTELEMLNTTIGQVLG